MHDEIERVQKIRKTLPQKREESVKKHKAKVGKVKFRMSHEEIGVHGIHYIVSFVANRLNECETAAELVLLEDLGFPFTSWYVYKAPISQEALQM